MCDETRKKGPLLCKSVVSWNSMLDGFCRSGDVRKARLLFNEIPEKDVKLESAYHSERMAVAPIRVVTNLQICRDCHSAMKLISQAYHIEIVIRDDYRFHRFVDGNCTCRDYW
ncbi:hypothetical protein ACFX13_017351 [Malus domestica]